MTGISRLPVQLKGLGTNMTFVMTYLIVRERSLICGDLHPGNRFVAHHFFANSHTVKCIALSFIASVLDFNLLVRVFISYQHRSLKRLKHNT